MSSQVVLTEISANTAKIILNKPEKSNAFDDVVIKNLSQSLELLANHSEIKLVLLCANGKHFSAGADVEWMQRVANYSYEENVQDALNLSKLLKLLNEFPKPVIGLAHGAVMGGAIGLLACCDMVISSDDAYFCFAEVKLGLIPATIAPYIMQAIGIRAMRRYFLSAEKFSANEAWYLGLVHQVVKKEELFQHANILAEQILQNAPQAISSAKSLIHHLNPISKEISQETANLLAKIRISKEGQEGLQAFLNKRKPIWKN